MRLNLVFGLALVGAGWGLPSFAHGISLRHQQVPSVEIEARFDNGEPMVEAQVLVYAPGNPTEAWQEGITDDQGHFSFVPDPAQPGEWEVMVRQAGHGGVTTIPVSAGMSNPGTEAETAANSVISPTTGLSSVQRGITIGSVIWGFIGTALFFARGKR